MSVIIHKHYRARQDLLAQYLPHFSDYMQALLDVHCLCTQKKPLCFIKACRKYDCKFSHELYCTSNTYKQHTNMHIHTNNTQLTHTNTQTCIPDSCQYLIIQRNIISGDTFKRIAHRVYHLIRVVNSVYTTLSDMNSGSL